MSCSMYTKVVEANTVAAKADRRADASVYAADVAFTARCAAEAAYTAAINIQEGNIEVAAKAAKAAKAATDDYLKDVEARRIAAIKECQHD